MRISALLSLFLFCVLLSTDAVASPEKEPISFPREPAKGRIVHVVEEILSSTKEDLKLGKKVLWRKTEKSDVKRIYAEEVRLVKPKLVIERRYEESIRSLGKTERKTGEAELVTKAEPLKTSVHGKKVFFGEDATKLENRTDPSKLDLRTLSLVSNLCRVALPHVPVAVGKTYEVPASFVGDLFYGKKYDPDHFDISVKGKFKSLRGADAEQVAHLSFQFDLSIKGAATLPDCRLQYRGTVVFRLADGIVSEIKVTKGPFTYSTKTKEGDYSAVGKVTLKATRKLIAPGEKSTD